MNATEFLQATRKQLSNPAQWRKDGLRNGGGLCIVHTMNNVLMFTATNISEVERGVAAVLTVLGRLGIDGKLPVWNDDPATTHADLLMVLDMAIVELGGPVEQLEDQHGSNVKVAGSTPAGALVLA